MTKIYEFLNRHWLEILVSLLFVYICTILRSDRIYLFVLNALLFGVAVGAINNKRPWVAALILGTIFHSFNFFLLFLASNSRIPPILSMIYKNVFLWVYLVKIFLIYTIVLLGSYTGAEARDYFMKKN